MSNIHDLLLEGGYVSSYTIQFYREDFGWSSTITFENQSDAHEYIENLKGGIKNTTEVILREVYTKVIATETIEGNK